LSFPFQQNYDEISITN